VVASVIEPNQRLERALAAFVRQEFGAPIATIIGLTEMLIEDARSGEEESLRADLDRIHSAGLLLQEQLSQLVMLATQGSLGDVAGLKAKLRHDLRTPLNAIKGYSELIMDEARDSGRNELAADVAKLLAAAEQLLGQVDKLVGLTDAAETKSAETAPHVGLPARELISQMMQTIRPITPEQNRDHLLSGRILVVDDTEANRELLSRRCRRYGARRHIGPAGGG
jgi:signal transduction histidine kinase